MENNFNVGKSDMENGVKGGGQRPGRRVSDLSAQAVQKFWCHSQPDTPWLQEAAQFFPAQDHRVILRHEEKVAS